MDSAIFQGIGSACSFRNYKENSFFIDQYEKVYSGSLDANENNIEEALEDIFTTFNINRPKDFKRHNLSVSDVVRLTIGDTYHWYYCNMVGWVDVTDDVMSQTKEIAKIFGD